MLIFLLICGLIFIGHWRVKHISVEKKFQFFLLTY